MAMIYVRQNRDHIVLGVGWVMLGVWVEIWSSTQQWNTSLPQVSFQQVANTANCIIKALYLPTNLPSLSLEACIEIISNLHFVEPWAKIRLAIFTLPERVWPNAPRLSPGSPWRLLLRALHDRHSPSPPCCSCLHHSPAFPHLSLKKKRVYVKAVRRKRYYLFLRDIASYQKPVWSCGVRWRVVGSTKMVWTADLFCWPSCLTVALYSHY